MWGWIPWWFILIVGVILVILWFIFGRKNYPFMGGQALLEAGKNVGLIDPIAANSLIGLGNMFSSGLLSSVTGLQVSTPPILQNPDPCSSWGPTTPCGLVETVPVPILPTPYGVPLGANGYHAPAGRWASENHCRTTVENMFRRPFPTARPDFLKNPESGKNFELDMYNEELALAVEYNGVQHYVFPNVFQTDEAKFLEGLRHDDAKRRLCDSSGVYLIVVPYTVHRDQIRAYIRERLPEDLKSIAL